MLSVLGGVGPYFLCAAIAALVSWIDLYKSAEDSVSYSVNPIVCREAFVFVVANGVFASGLYEYSVVFKSTSIAVALTWNQTDPWIRACTVGLSAILVARSRLFPLKDNKSLGLDVLYTRWRDRGVHALCIDTIAKRRAIVQEFGRAFVGDSSFIEDFTDMVLHMLTQNRQTEAVRNEYKQIEALKNMASDSAEEREIIDRSLIRSAVTFGNIHYVERRLKRRRRSGSFVRLGFRNKATLQSL